MMGPNEATLSDHAVILSNLAQSQSAGSNRFAHFIATQVHGAPVREGSSSGSCRLRALSDRFANNESLEAVANASSPPIAPDNAAPRQEPRDVGKSAESTINVDDESGEDSDSGESFAFADCKLVFNLADYLPERGYTKVPPNQHVFKGAEVGFVYEVAKDILRSQGATSLLENSTYLASMANTSSTNRCDHSSTGDVFKGLLCVGVRWIKTSSVIGRGDAMEQSVI
uniref:Uncharacterized protein n=1 Tax=Mesocestoides corti TaxID=53468 RepID=A0A5K3G1I6_MESCO